MTCGTGQSIFLMSYPSFPFLWYGPEAPCQTEEGAVIVNQPFSQLVCVCVGHSFFRTEKSLGDLKGTWHADTKQ